jgi:hypothetical protein
MDDDHDFDARVVELFDFWMLFGYFEVPLDYPGGLGVWLGRQRVQLAGHPLDLRYQRLEAIGVVFQTDPWEIRFEELLLFTHEHGHTRVPVEDGNELGIWLRGQRNELRNRRDDPHRQRLAEIGVEFHFA